MRMAYLGLFSTVFNWVFNRILAPIVKFIAQLISSVFEWVFNTILMPLLVLVFKTVLPWAIDLIVELLSGLLYEALVLICKTLDYMQEAFNIFAGAQNVIYKTGNTKVEMPLLDAIFYLPEVRNMFIAVLVAGVGLAFIFAIIAVIKSTIDIDFEGKRPVGAVLRSLFKTILNFLMINILVLFILNVSGIVLNAINQGGNANDTSLGRIVFCVSTFNAHKNPDMNIDKYSADNNILTDTDRKYFYLKNIDGALDYNNADDVHKFFEVRQLDFFVSGIVAVFLLVILFATSITFVQRIFEVIILYIVSPFFISTMPLDEGEKFKKWKELFIAKIFGGYGSVLAMNLFLLLVPFIMGNSITWGENSAESAYIFKLLFLCGGAYAMTKVGPMITTIINWQAGQAEAATAGMAGSLIGGYVAGQAFAGIKAFGAAAGRRAGKPLKTLFGSSGEAKEIADKKFNESNENGIAGKDRDKQPEDYEGLDKLQDKASDDEFYGTSMKNDTSVDKEKARDELKAQKDEEKGNKEKEPPKQYDDPLKGNEAEDTRSGAAKTFDSIVHKAHDIFPAKSDKNGNYSVGFLGFKLNYNKDGRRTGFKVPGLSFRVGKDGSFKLDKINIAGICSIKRGGKTGSFSLSSVPAIGLSRYEDKDGQMRTSSLLGFHQEKGQDGQMHVTSGLFGISRSANPDGTYHTDSVAGIKFGRGYDESTGEYKTNSVRIGNMIWR